METLRQRLKEKDETIERQLQTVKAAQQEKKNSDSRFHEITEHMKVKERKICVLQRKVRDSSLCFLLTMVLVCLLTGGVLTWLSVWSEVQTLSTAQLMPLPLTVSCFSKIQLVLPFWYRLTAVVPDKGPLNGCVCVCVLCNYYYSTASCASHIDAAYGCGCVDVSGLSVWCVCCSRPLALQKRQNRSTGCLGFGLGKTQGIMYYM